MSDDPNLALNSRKNDLPVYEEHAGTIRIGGGTVPKNAGNCAYSYLLNGLECIEFFCIGANANQQATKAMGVFRFAVAANLNFKDIDIAFQPIRFLTYLQDRTTSKEREMDATVWRTVIVQRKKE